ncbi:MAG TPA: thiamine-phosphate kinase [Phycisphaerales bacterium]|nr:thiamine-phosphate kinase [Phycisphaerales bacterium]
MREGELLNRIFARSATLSDAFPAVEVGPGDDCAVVVAPGGSRLLLKVDQVVEGRHFTTETPLDLIARKAIARAVSDIAAMAGTPLASLVGAVLPHGYEQSRADALYDALLKWSLHFGCPLVGGDTAIFARGSGGVLTLSVSIIGTPHAARGPVLRGGARPGDDVFVTGTIGGSFRQHADADFPFPGGGKHLTFTPRTREATALADTLGESLHAMMDISDGLGLDAARLATRSNAAIELDANRIPLSPGQSDPLRAAAHGEDYELLFTTAPGAPVPATIAGTPLTRIGRVIAYGTGNPRCVLIHNGTRTPADALGWEHAG